MIAKLRDLWYKYGSIKIKIKKYDKTKLWIEDKNSILLCISKGITLVKIK